MENLQEQNEQEQKKQKNKVYGKNYYEKNKDVILQKASTKTICPFCDRCVSAGNFNTHRKSNLCAKFTKQKIELSKLSDLIKSKLIDVF